MTLIYRELLDDGLRASHTGALFGVNFPLHLEPTVFDLAGRLSGDYLGGLWHFYALCNGGFYMAPQSDRMFDVRCENGFDGSMSADALGLTVCLYSYSTLAFHGLAGFSATCAQQYHRVREYMLDHAEAREILAAID